MIDSGEPCEGLAFFYKMKGDFYRYIAEVYSPCKRLDEIIKNADEAYKKSMAVKIHAGSQVKLNCALNQSIFLADLMKNVPEAIKTCERAISDSTDKIEELSDEEFKEAKALVTQMKENIKIWHEMLKKVNFVVE